MFEEQDHQIIGKIEADAAADQRQVVWKAIKIAFLAVALGSFLSIDFSLFHTIFDGFAAYSDKQTLPAKTMASFSMLIIAALVALMNKKSIILAIIHRAAQIICLGFVFCTALILAIVTMTNTGIPDFMAVTFEGMDMEYCDLPQVDCDAPEAEEAPWYLSVFRTVSNYAVPAYVLLIGGLSIVIAAMAHEFVSNIKDLGAGVWGQWATARQNNRDVARLKVLARKHARIAALPDDQSRQASEVEASARKIEAEIAKALAQIEILLVNVAATEALGAEAAQGNPITRLATNISPKQLEDMKTELKKHTAETIATSITASTKPLNVQDTTA